MTSKGRGLITALIVAGGIALAVPATGQAGVASVSYVHCVHGSSSCDPSKSYWAVHYADPSSHEYAPGAAEKNTVTLSEAPVEHSPDETIAVVDESAIVTAGDGCVSKSDHEAWCSHDETHSAWADGPGVKLGGGDDKLTVGDLSFGIYGDGGAGNDTLTGGALRDTLSGGYGNDVLDGGGSGDYLRGGPGYDTISYASRGADEPVSVRLDGNNNDGADPEGLGHSYFERDWDESIEYAVGGAGDDLLVGNSDRNVLRGGDGHDTLDGGLGSDALNGGLGNDTVTYASRASNAPVAVTLDGLGNDGSDPNRDGVSAADEERDGDTSIENAIGGAGHDRLTGSRLVNSLFGGPGLDRLDGGLGADLLDGGTGSDTMYYAGRAADKPVAVVLDGLRNDGWDPNRDGVSSGLAEERDQDVSIENATGGEGHDLLRSALASANILIGNGGDDRLFARDGGGAIDRLSCGAGADSFQIDPSDTKIGCETAIP